MKHQRKPISNKLRFEILKRDSFKCQYCGRSAPSVVLEVDHIHPVSLGGNNSPGNLVTACLPCNQAKRARTLENRMKPVDTKRAQDAEIDPIAVSCPFDYTMADVHVTLPARGSFMPTSDQVRVMGLLEDAYYESWVKWGTGWTDVEHVAIDNDYSWEQLVELDAELGEI